MFLLSWKKEMLSLPELRTRARLSTESTARAPGMDTFAGVVEVQFAAQTVARPFWPVLTMAARCKRDGSRRETWLSFGLKETAVLEKDRKSTRLNSSHRC